MLSNFFFAVNTLKMDEAATFLSLRFIQEVQLMTRRKCLSCLSLSEPNRLIHLRNINFSLFYRVATDKLIFFFPQTNLFFISILLFAHFGEEKKKAKWDTQSNFPEKTTCYLLVLHFNQYNSHSFNHLGSN